MKTGVQGKDIAGIGLIVLVVPVVLILLGGGVMGFGMMDGYNGPWWEFLLLVFWVADIGGIALLTIWALRSSGPTTALVQIPIDKPHEDQDGGKRPVFR